MMLCGVPGVVAMVVCLQRVSAFSIATRNRLVSRRSITTCFGSTNDADATTTTQTVSSVTEAMRTDAMEQMRTIHQHYSSSSSSIEAPFTLLRTRQEASDFVRQHVDALLFDCDGVLYRGLDQAPDATACLRNLLGSGKTCLFVTNNAGANRQQLRDKLANLLDCPALTVDQMIGSTYACAQYLKSALVPPQQQQDKSAAVVHVIGTEGLCQEIRESGFTVTGGPRSQEQASMSREELADYDFDAHPPVDAVVVGLDTDFSYRKLCIATVLLQRNPGAILVSTNQDAYDLVGADARHLPGNGCLVKALEHASQRQAINVGKPSRVLADLVLAEHNLDPARTMMVGDRLDTDIRFGVENGMIGTLVLTGCTTAQDLVQHGDATQKEPMPDIVVPYMGLLA